MYETFDGEAFLAPESIVPEVRCEPARGRTSARRAAPASAPSLPRSPRAAAARNRLEAWARHAMGANGFGAAGHGKP